MTRPWAAGAGALAGAASGLPQASREKVRARKDARRKAGKLQKRRDRNTHPMENFPGKPVPTIKP